MLKRPTKIDLKDGSRFSVGKACGHGGNGDVFYLNKKNVKEIEQKAVIKFFAPKAKSEKERNIRLQRFKEEIEVVSVKLRDIDGIIPILYDYRDVASITEADSYWYIMLLAKTFNVRAVKPIDVKLKEFLALAKTIGEIHHCDNKLAHRDLKPENLLYFNERLCLSDFGLVFSDGTEDLTEEGVHIGPRWIRPPELEDVYLRININYQKSDIYMFAKNLWMYLKRNTDGFSGPYNISDERVFLNYEDFGVPTLMPIHEMLIRSTKHDIDERCDIDECISFIERQLAVCEGNVSRESIEKMRFEENSIKFSSQIKPDGKIYKSIIDIAKIINGLSVSFSLEIQEGNLYALPVTNISVFGEKSLRCNYYDNGVQIYSFILEVDRLEFEDNEWKLHCVSLLNNSDSPIPMLWFNNSFDQSSNLIKKRFVAKIKSVYSDR